MRKKPVRYALCFLPLVLLCEHANPQSSSEDRAATRAEQMRELEAKIQRDLEQYNKFPRRRFVGASVQDPRLAGYVDQCLKKILQVAASDRLAEMAAMSGSAMVTVAIRSDGTIEKIEVNRSSGQKRLDDILVRLVRLAEPFEPFPDDLRKNTDVLSVTRTFRVGKSNDRTPGEVLWSPEPSRAPSR